MFCLLQRNFRTSVKKDKDELLLAETSYSSSAINLIAKFLVNQETFIINEAYLEKQTPNKGKEVLSVPDLHGVTAYLGSGIHLRKALKRFNDPLIFKLFAETVKGVIQAEQFLLKERGYTSVAEYFNYWVKAYAGSCRYYSTLDRSIKHTEEAFANKDRSGYLFLRYKTYMLYTQSETFRVIGSLCDIHHEMNFSLHISDRILSVEGNILRVPDKICEGATMFFPNLVGIDALSCSKKDISSLLGNRQGCVHLIDVINDSINTYKNFLQK